VKTIRPVPVISQYVQNNFQRARYQRSEHREAVVSWWALG